MIENKEIHFFIFLDYIKDKNMYIEYITELRKNFKDSWISVYYTDDKNICCGLGENNFLLFDKNQNKKEIFINHSNIVNKKIIVVNSFKEDKKNLISYVNIFLSNNTNILYEDKYCDFDCFNIYRLAGLKK